MTDSGPTANWYPDPTGRNELRYWDGSGWTDHVSNQSQQKVEPLVISPHVHELSPTIVEPRDSSAVAGAEPTKKPGVLGRMRDDRRAKASGRDEFQAIATRAAAGDVTALAALPAAVADAQTLYRASALEKRLWDTMAVAVRSVVDDDILSVEEEEHLHKLGEILGTPVQAIEQKDHQLFEELVIAGINDGRFPRLPNPGIMLKRGEEAHASFSASLMKEQAIREFRAGATSVSIPLGHGIRYRVGGVRGRSVVVGAAMVVQDSGVLYVTNQRVLFAGRAKTLEFRNDRLVGMEQFTDGLRLNVSNRQTASLFTMTSPSIATALITATVAHSN
jgi:hypothetical protein